eukprot:460333-Pyramimonas_sp.AAC.1
MTRDRQRSASIVRNNQVYVQASRACDERSSKLRHACDEVVTFQPRNMLSGPLRLVPTPGICSLVPCD